MSLERRSAFFAYGQYVACGDLVIDSAAPDLKHAMLPGVFDRTAHPPQAAFTVFNAYPLPASESSSATTSWLLFGVKDPAKLNPTVTFALFTAPHSPPTSTPAAQFHDAAVVAVAPSLTFTDFPITMPPRGLWQPHPVCALGNNLFACFSMRGKSITVWDGGVKAFTHTWYLESAFSHKAVAALPGCRLAVGDAWGATTVYNGLTGAIEAILTGHTDMVTVVTALPAQELVATGSMDGTICVWHAPARAAPRFLTRLVGHTGWITAMCPLATGGLASGAMDRTLRVWQPEAWEKLDVSSMVVDRGVVTANEGEGDGRGTAYPGKSLADGNSYV